MMNAPIQIQVNCQEYDKSCPNIVYSERLGEENERKRDSERLPQCRYCDRDERSTHLEAKDKQIPVVERVLTI